MSTPPPPPNPTGQPYLPPQPGPPPTQKSRGILARLASVAVTLLVILGISFACNQFRGGTTKSPIGSCLTVSGKSSYDVKTAEADCDSTQMTYIVAAHKDGTEACKEAKYPFYVTQSGRRSRTTAICLVPNFTKGQCYSDKRVGGVGLEIVPCTTTSTLMSVTYKITERVDSTTVPNCTNSGTQRVFAFDIASDPPRQFGACAQIVGNYTWK